MSFAVDLAEFLAARRLRRRTPARAVAWTLLTADGRRAFWDRLAVDEATWDRGRG
jgi:hypothetical protein